MRGPGETQLETDRRLLRVRISHLAKNTRRHPGRDFLCIILSHGLRRFNQVQLRFNPQQITFGEEGLQGFPFNS